MSIINDYEVRLLAADRQHELQAEAVEAHLAREVRAGRPSWTRRLGQRLRSLSGRSTGRRSAAVTRRPRHGH